MIARKTLVTIALLFVCVILVHFETSCTTQQQQTLLSPTAIGSYVQTAATAAKPYLSAQEVTVVSTVRADIQSAAGGNLTPSQLQGIVALFKPTSTSNQNGALALSLALNAASLAYSIAYQQYSGTPQATVLIQYVNNFAQGLQNSGF